MDASTRYLISVSLVAAVCLWIVACTVHYYYVFFRRPAALVDMFPNNEWRMYPPRINWLTAVYGLSAIAGTGVILYTAASSMLWWLSLEIRLVVAINFAWWGTFLMFQGMYATAHRIVELERRGQ